MQPDSHSLARGTAVPVDLTSVIDSSIMFAGFITALTSEDIKGADGRLAIPAGSPAALMVREAKKVGAISTLQLGLYSINVAGKQSTLTDGAKDAATIVLTEDAGKGSSHASVHLQRGAHLVFRLDRPVDLR